MAKTKYNKNFPLLVEGYAREGLTDILIAQKLGISKDTFYKYIKRYPDFADFLKKGKAPVDFKVENALLKRALGYKYNETKTVALTSTGDIKRAKAAGLDTKSIILRQEITEKELAPDVTAQIFWLKNRKSLEWRDKKDFEGKFNFTIEDIHDLLNDEENVE